MNSRTHPRRAARAAFALIVMAAAAGCTAPVATMRSGIDDPPDPAVPLASDFYRNVDGLWLKAHEIPADKSRIGAFDQINDEIQLQLRGLVEGAPSSGRIGAIYAGFMDEAAIERAGVAPLAPELAAIDAIGTTRELVATMGRLVRDSVDMPFDMGIGQDAKDSTQYVVSIGQSGLALPDRDYYLTESDAKFKHAREAYVDYLTAILGLAGDRNAAASGRSVLAIETKLAAIQWTRVQNRDPVKTYNRVDMAQWAALAPAIDARSFLDPLQITTRVDRMVVRQPSYFTGLAGVLDSVPLADWKAYVKAHLISRYAPYLSKPFVDARFAFVGTELRGATENLPRWKRGVAVVQMSVRDDLGQLYVGRYFPPENKARMERLVGNLLASYAASIDSLEWMGPETKKQAHAKLATFSPKIGYPKRWIDYAALDIRPGDLVGNVRRASAFESDRQARRLGGPVDRDEWHMAPQTVNAYYNPLMNEIVFPAAILQPPFFDVTADDAVNYGGIGAVIGHEISHGFDDKGSQFDAQGNLRNWWTKEDRDRFEVRTMMLSKQYGAYSPLPGYFVNGDLTLGENIADNSGLAIAWKAWQRSLDGKPSPVIDGMTGGERFFRGFGQVWRGKTRDAAMLSQIKSDPHSPGEFRANGTVRNHPEFYRVFGVKPGDAMYLPPDQRVLLW